MSDLNATIRAKVEAAITHIELPDGRAVLAAKKTQGGRQLEIERLLNLKGEYGTASVHGLLWKASAAELEKALKWVFGVKKVVVVKQTLVP